MDGKEIPSYFDVFPLVAAGVLALGALGFWVLTDREAFATPSISISLLDFNRFIAFFLSSISLCLLLYSTLDSSNRGSGIFTHVSVESLIWSSGHLLFPMETRDNIVGCFSLAICAILCSALCFLRAYRGISGATLMGELFPDSLSSRSWSKISIR